MIGTEDGFWFSMLERPDGLVEYEFFQLNQRLQDGACQELEMFQRFDIMCEAFRASAWNRKNHALNT